MVYYAGPCPFIFPGTAGNPGELLKSLKAFTSKGLAKAIEENLQESRKKWMLALMEEQVRRIATSVLAAAQ